MLLVALLSSAAAETIFEKQVNAAPSKQTRFSISGLNTNKGALALQFKADFLSINDNQPRHVFHLWADPFNRVDAIYDPLQSHIEVTWVGEGRRTSLKARDLYWQGKVTHQVALTWQAAAHQSAGAAAKMQLALSVDGQQVDTNAEAVPMKTAPATLLLGHAEIGKSFSGQIETVRLCDSTSIGTAAGTTASEGGVPAQGNRPVTPVRDGPVWKETPEEIALLAKFNATQKVVYLVHVRGGAEREARVDNKNEPTYVDVYGIKMISITKKMIKNGWLETNKPSVLYGPGGGVDGRDSDVEAILRSYVEKGAGYYGICSGSYYAMDLGLFDPKQRVRFSGKQMTAVRFDPTHPIFYNVESFFRGEPHTAYYLHYSGPTWRPTAYPDAKAIMLFDEGAGVAMWDKRFGQGRVIVSSPHPEMSEFASEKNALQQRRIFRNTLYYITGMLPVAHETATGAK